MIYSFNLLCLLVMGWHKVAICGHEDLVMDIDGNNIPLTNMHKTLSIMLENNDICNNQNEKLKLVALDAFDDALELERLNLFHNDQLIHEILNAPKRCDQLSNFDNSLYDEDEISNKHESHGLPSFSSHNSVPSLDYALHNAGSKVVHSLTSPTYFPKEINDRVEQYLSYVGLWELTRYISIPDTIKSIFDFLGVNPGLGVPEDALIPKLSLGACWPMKGSEGQLVVQLKEPVRIHSVTIDHIRSVEAVNIETAPRNFEVYGQESADTPQTLLVSGTYVLDGSDHIQNFPLDDHLLQLPAFQIVTLRVLDNHGSKDYTCLYRLRVHGTPVYL